MNLQDQVTQLQRQLDELRRDYYKDNFSDNQIFRKDVSFTRKVGFFDTQPVYKQPAVTTPSGGGTGSGDAIDISARTAIGQIKTILQNLGLTQ